MNVPKLRFKEFNDNWKLYKLSDLVEFFKGNLLAKSDLDDNGKYPCILYGQLYTKYKEVIKIIESKTKRDEKNIPRSKKGDVLIPSSGETPIDISTSSCIQSDNVLLGGDINILRPINCDGRFLSYVINNNKKTEIARVAQGHSVVHLYIDNLKHVSINVPSIKEQNKIADVLELLDKKIELQNKRIEDLKLFKKGLSKNIFNLLTKYEKIKLGNACDIVTGKLDANAMVENGKYRFYTCAKEYYMIDKYAYDTEALLISGNGAYVGYIHYYNGKFNAYQRTYILHNFKYNVQYIKCYLDEYLSEKINLEKKDGNTPYIVLSTLSDMIIKIPSSFEQLKISKIINICNCKLEIEKNKLIKLKELKKGLMQNMFV